jgi:hypothetical protein
VRETSEHEVLELIVAGVPVNAASDDQPVTV